MGHFTQLDWIVLIAYFLLTLAIGLYFWRKSRSAEGFTAANRSLSGWLVGLSIFATYLSSISYLALPGKAFVGNWNAFVFSLTVPVATVVAVIWFLPYYRKNGDISAYAGLEQRFGTWARVYAGSCYLLIQLARIGVVTYLLALPMSVLFGWNIATIIIVTGVIVTLYTFIGGILAVIWTDAIQTVVLLVGAVVALVFLSLHLESGVIGAVSQAWDSGKMSLGEPGVSTAPSGSGNLTFQFGSATILVVFLYGLCENLKNFGIDQSYVQRYQTARNESEARKSLWLGALLYLPVSALFFLIGTLLFVLYHQNGSSNDLYEVKQIVAHQKLMQEGIVPSYTTDSKTGQRCFADDYQNRIDARAQSLSDNAIGDRVFPHFIGKYLPPGLTGLLIAAIFSAGMSTISSSLNSSATLILRDYYQRFFRPNASDRESMLVLYAGTILWGIIGTGVGLLLIRLTDSALDIWWTLVGIFGGSLLGLFLIGMMIKRAGNGAAIVSVFFGTLLIAWMTIPELIRWLAKQGFTQSSETLAEYAGFFGSISPYHPNMIPVASVLLMLGLASLVSLLDARKR